MGKIYLLENHVRYMDADESGSIKKNHINGVRYDKWIALDEAIYPINTTYGRWPEMNDQRWHAQMYSSATMFLHSNIVFVINIVGEDLTFGTVPFSWAAARAKDDWEKVVGLSSVEKSQDLPTYSETANAFGKVLYVVGEYLDDKKPPTLTFNNATSKLGKVYARAFRAPSVQAFFKTHGYTFEVAGSEEIEDFGKWTTFSLNKI